ncbi:MAG: helix-turn-helix domain-containing protein [Ruminococcaceae bacterium]|nr:helix-turn-helix domain-containing protein [Oscillospiraceae bacterium]
MLSENLKKLRKAKGLSQEELSIRLNVVRQTISKWEKGLSVPDSEMLIRLAEELDTTVTVLLGETVEETEAEDVKSLSAKLELLNEQFARQNETRRKIWRGIFITITVIAGLVLAKELIEFLFTQGMFFSMKEQESIGIIGGADGPTMILVTNAVNPVSDWIFALIAVIVSVIGICKTGRK